jgi:hypothetical protein
MGVPLTPHLFTVDSRSAILATLVEGVSIICTSSKHVRQNRTPVPPRAMLVSYSEECEECLEAHHARTQ